MPTTRQEEWYHYQPDRATGTLRVDFTTFTLFHEKFVDVVRYTNKGSVKYYQQPSKNYQQSPQNTIDGLNIKLQNFEDGSRGIDKDDNKDVKSMKDVILPIELVT